MSMLYNIVMITVWLMCMHPRRRVNQVKIICIALFTMHIVSEQLYRKSWFLLMLTIS